MKQVQFSVKYAFGLAYFLLAVVFVGAMFTVINLSSHSVKWKTRTVMRDQPVLSSESSVAEATARFGPPTQQVDGQQISSQFPRGTVCNIYQAKAWIDILCYVQQ